MILMKKREKKGNTADIKKVEIDYVILMLYNRAKPLRKFLINAFSPKQSLLSKSKIDILL